MNIVGFEASWAVTDAIHTASLRPYTECIIRHVISSIKGAADTWAASGKGELEFEEAVGHWREISSLVEKIGQEQERFTRLTAGIMKKTAQAVQDNGTGSGGVSDAKAALQQMLKSYQESVRAMLKVQDVWEDEERKLGLLQEWFDQASRDASAKSRLERLEGEVLSLEVSQHSF
eukprot:scaffold18153_cov32-Prasinocladus_malaysianus.AAC.1